ncbi:MAG: hypothetical protein LBJ81_00205 [Puniceicoccales bacterium]|jgi:hypothetical protein|nr:hypothetical protein [Puniceicoccales bacterium]
MDAVMKNTNINKVCAGMISFLALTGGAFGSTSRPFPSLSGFVSLPALLDTEKETAEPETQDTQGRQRKPWTLQEFGTIVRGLLTKDLLNKSIADGARALHQKLPGRTQPAIKYYALPIRQALKANQDLAARFRNYFELENPSPQQQTDHTEDFEKDFENLIKAAREPRTEHKKAYHQKHKKEMQAYGKADYQNHKEERKAYAKKRRQDNKEKVRGQEKEYYQKHKKERQAYAKKHRQDNKEKAQGQGRKSYQKHKKERQAHNKAYRAKKKQQAAAAAAD